MSKEMSVNDHGGQLYMQTNEDCITHYLRSAIDTSAGVPSELRWLAVSPDDRFVVAANFGFRNLGSFRIDGNMLNIAKDPACPKVPGDVTFGALNGKEITSALDSVILRAASRRAVRVRTV
jgi:hypothetical protein